MRLTKQGLSERVVVDLVRTGVWFKSSRGEDTGVEAGLLLDECGEARGFGQRIRRPT